MPIEAINARNQFRGRIAKIVIGSVVSEAEIETPLGPVASVVATRSLRDLGFEVVALVKSTDVALAKLQETADV